MDMCERHFYGGALPCPWPNCENGTATGELDINGHAFRARRFEDAGEGVYAWIVDGRSAEDRISALVRGTLARIQLMPLSYGTEKMYHFSSVSGCLGILNSDELWLTDFRELEDKREMAHGLAVARETLAGFEDELQPRTRQLLHRILDVEPVEPFFVSCFSMIEDSSTHWLDYADDEKGAAIIFEPSGFEELLRADLRAISMSRVLYRFVVKTGLFLNMAVLTDSVAELDASRGLYDEARYADELEKLLAELLPVCKDHGYSKEHEIRLVVVPGLSLSGTTKAARVHCRESNGKTASYLRSGEIATGFRLPIEGVLVGAMASDDDFNAIAVAGAKRGVAVERARRTLRRGSTSGAAQS
jgi:hypothetical protein